MLPARRQKPISGILRALKREWPRHRAFVRRHICIIADKHECEGPIVFAHVRSAANSGVGIKPFDWEGVSMCDCAHREQHQIGQPAFERKYGVDLKNLAAEFAAKSPDTAMREALRQA